MALLLESEVRERAKRYAATMSSIRRMARAVSELADFRGRSLESPWADGMDRESTGMEATIKVNKPYKPRRLKMDMNHIVQRRTMKKVRRKPQWKQRHKKVVKKYMQRFGKQLKKRAEKVSQIRKQRHLD